MFIGLEAGSEDEDQCPISPLVRCWDGTHAYSTRRRPIGRRLSGISFRRQTHPVRFAVSERPSFANSVEKLFAEEWVVAVWC